MFQANIDSFVVRPVARIFHGGCKSRKRNQKINVGMIGHAKLHGGCFLRKIFKLEILNLLEIN